MLQYPSSSSFLLTYQRVNAKCCDFLSQKNNFQFTFFALPAKICIKNICSIKSDALKVVRKDHSCSVTHYVFISFQPTSPAAKYVWNGPARGGLLGLRDLIQPGRHVDTGVPLTGKGYVEPADRVVMSINVCC